MRVSLVSCVQKFHSMEMSDSDRAAADDDDSTFRSISPDISSVHGSREISTDKKESSENKEQLMDKILDLEEEIDDLRLIVKSKEEKKLALESEIEELQKEMKNMKENLQRREAGLLQDLDILHEKNEILSNLLDIVNERADALEDELGRQNSHVIQSFASPEMRRKCIQSHRAVTASNSTSTGSDEVFPEVPDDNSQVIHKEWEDQFRKRISCLERLLAEERRKVAAAEKKMKIAEDEAMASGLSDDVKLHRMEKELLQDELLVSQKHVKISSEQIRSLTEKLRRYEAEAEAASLHSFESSLNSKNTTVDNEPELETMRDEGKDYRTLAASLQVELQTTRDECRKYRALAEDMECKVSEVNDIWISKSTASEKEKKNIEEKYLQKIDECKQLEDMTKKHMEDARRKDVILKEKDNFLKDKTVVISRKDELIQEQEDIIRQREEDMQSLLDQISQRERCIREINESVRSRDERLKEKDDMIQKLNAALEDKNEENHFIEDELQKATNQIKEYEETTRQLKEQISKTDKDTKTEIENENIRLKSDIENLMSNIEQQHSDSFTLQTELDKAKHALSEAMLMWDRDRSTLSAELNILREKVRLFESSAGKKDSQIIAALRKETVTMLEQREKLANELRLCRMESDNTIRILKLDKYKLQEELTSKMRMLTHEITSNDKMSDELVVLRQQDDVAYQLRHHERMLRAEYLAMKVRYETQLERLQKEHLELIAVVAKLQKEKTMDTEIIMGVQKGMHNIRETYTHDLSRWSEEKKVLHKHITDIEEGQEIACHLKAQIDGLKRQLAEQEVERAELVNKMTTERNAWDIERSQLTSKINQLEEKLVLMTQHQSKSIDIKYRMEMTWERERNEQKRLLSEAHKLALDLQDQLHDHDEAFAQERKRLITEVELLKEKYDAELKSKNRKSLEADTCETRVKHFESLLETEKELHKNSENMWMREKGELLRRLAQMRKLHNKDCRRIDEVLTGLRQLRELAAMIVDADRHERQDGSYATAGTSFDRVDGAASASTGDGEMDIAELKRNLDQVVLKHVKESLRQIHFAAEDLARPTEVKDEEKQMLRRSLSSSEIDMLKEEFLEGRPMENINVYSNRQELLPQTRKSEKEHFTLQRSITHSGGTVPSENMPPNFIEKILSEQSSYFSESRKEHYLETRWSRIPTETGTFKRSNLPRPPPSFLIPRSRSTSPKPHPQEPQKQKVYESASVDTSSSSRLSAPQLSCNGKALSQTESFPIPSPFVAQSPSGHSLPHLGKPNMGSLDRLSPKSSRLRFFQQDSPSKNIGWPDVHSTSSVGVMSTSLELHRSTDSEFDVGSGDTAKPAIRQSRSFDDKELDSVLADPSERALRCKHEKQLSEKEKRRFMKKSQSVDNSGAKSTFVGKLGFNFSGPVLSSTFSPVGFFSAVKKKFKPLRRSHSARETSKPFTEIAEPPMTSLRVEMSPKETAEGQMTVVPIPDVSEHDASIHPKHGKTTDYAQEDSSNRPGTVVFHSKPHTQKKRPRSKSAERPQPDPSTLQPILVHAGETTQPKWQFSETPV